MNYEPLDFNLDLNFDQFKILLDKYDKTKKYPDINS